MSLNYKIVKCHKCGKLISRANDRKDATCFDCKVKRKNLAAKKQGSKKLKNLQ